MKTNLILFLSFLLTLLFSGYCIAANAHYYKCTTDRGTVFSQFPCGSNATEHKIKQTNVAFSDPNANHVKTLNTLEQQQIVRNLNAQIRSQNHQLDILSRDRDRAEFNQQQRLKRILSDSEIKKVTKDIKKQLKEINKRYARDVKKVEKQIDKLEKKLKRYE
ncbi:MULTISPECIES: DUF4124 domain-containing protein [unclassified Pseudoalteromonas]|uniref:DUF4124 domain-containing protein n=1 Tax=unclassified Pseudoalteromonas TaxID=194690 RepID=UPI0025B2833A|nr:MULTISPECIES: DUF4124 domain-containing protein [unclassified Pseudoalteromonas]MDN3377675.1 DUF4124 domain-containing protein [Pseudoalteromonas sp. APC 3893]MDN3385871.1 DUF4124 domain-containing protein [Pseudoalteromonas sp. APC 4017]